MIKEKFDLKYYNEVEIWAEKHNMSINNAINFMIKYFLDQNTEILVRVYKEEINNEKS